VVTRTISREKVDDRHADIGPARSSGQECGIGLDGGDGEGLRILELAALLEYHDSEKEDNPISSP